MKLGTRIAMGFGIVVLIAVALGGTGYVMFNRIDANVVELSGHSLPAVQSATGVERTALETIMQEKEFLLDKSDKSAQQGKEKLATVLASLDKVDEVARKYNDKSLADKSGEVRGIATQFGQLFDEGVGAIKKNAEAYETMGAKGEQVSNEAEAYMAAKKSEYLEGKTALAVVNRINALALETRMSEKGYMLYKEQKYFDVIEKNIAELLKCYDELEKYHPDATEQKQITDARKATQDYFEAAKSWVETQKQTAQGADVMQDKGQLVSQQARDYQAAKKAEYLEAKNALAVVNTISSTSFETRMYANKYMLTKEQKNFDAVTTGIAKLLKCYDELEKLHPDATEQKQIADARKATQEYFDTVKDWAEEYKKDSKSSTLDPLAAKMVEYAMVVGKAAEDYLTAKKDKVDKTADAVFIVSAIDQTAYRIRLREREYMLQQDEKTWQDMNALLADLNKYYDDLRKVSLTTEDQQRIETASKATAEYQAAAKAWVENDAKMKGQATTMDNGGGTVGKAAAEYLAAKQDKIDKTAEAVFIVADIAQGAPTARMHALRYMLKPEEQTWKALVDQVAGLDKMYDGLRKVSLTADDEQRIERADKATGEYQVAAKSWAENDNKVRLTILPQMKDIGTKVITTAQTAENDAWKVSDQRSADVSGIVGSSKAIIIIALAIGVLVGIAAAFVITRGITKPINRIIAGLTDGADQVNDAAGQVSSASQQLAGGASEQASSLEETSSALEQMAAMTRTNADNSKQANELAGQARQAAQNGDKTMGQLNEAMTGINESSEKISKIIKVIEEIAFQTNLLALNAAVEAARAGEHGKGFAVVADEVRNLAQRCAQAARETTGLIEDAVNRSRQGTEVAGEVGKALSEIVTDVSKVSELINGISQASQEQAQGVDQVNTAVSQMDKVTQQNASGAEESASASEELAAQAMAVKGMVNELTALVGGKNAGPTSVTGSTGAAPRRAKAKTATLPKTKAQAAADFAMTASSGKPSDEFMDLEADGAKGADF